MVAALIMTMAGSAANPSSGTLSAANPTLTYSTGPNLISNPSGTAELNCTELPCDEYALTINVPASFEETHQVRVNITWPSPAEDYDLNVSDAGSSGNSPGIPETVIFAAKSGTHTVQVVPYAVAGGTFTGRITLEEKPAPPAGGGAVSAGTSPRFETYNPPAESGLGTSAGEPSVGFGKPTSDNPSGRYMFVAGLETLRVTFDDCASPAKALWEDVTAPTTSITTLDPILESDKDGYGRTIVSQLGPKSSFLAFTDNDGGVDGKAPTDWTPGILGAPINPGVDHQTIGIGPFVPGLPDSTNGYPSAVYYASQDIAVAQLGISRDGGLTFGPAVPMYNLTQCGGLHGHVTVGPDGTVYVPNKGCTPTAAGVEGGGVQGFAISEDEGTTFKVRTVPGSSSGNNDPSIGVGRGDLTGGKGRLYFGYSQGGRPMIAVSSDKGVTFSTPIDVGAPFGIRNTVFPQVVAGDDDRASFMFLGTPTSGDYQNMANFKGEWHMYISTTYDGGATWSTVDTTPNDPVQLGSICTGGTTCGEDRNLLDFNDLKMDYEGRIVGAYADGCVGCTSPSGSRSALAAIVRQSGGKRLLSQFDPPTQSVPRAPRVDGVTATATGVSVVWQAPDNGGSPITGYNVYRKTGTGGAFGLIGNNLSPAKTNFNDSSVAANQTYFYKVTASNINGESASCGEHGVGAAPVVGDPCVLPGITVATDPAGDSTGSGVVASQDLRLVSVAEPFFPDGSQKLVFTLKLNGGFDPAPPPNTVWYAVFTYRGVNYFVDMNTGDNPAIPAFEFGRVDPDPNTGVNQQTGLGAADPESGFSPDGTIVLVLSTNKLDEPVTIGGAAQATPVAGDVLENVKGEVRALLGAGGTGLITIVDDTGGSNYTLVGNSFCRPNTAPVASLSANPATGNAPLNVTLDASSSTDADAPGDTIASYTFDFGDGSAPVTQPNPTVTHTYSAGNYRATVRVTDSRGKPSNNTAGANIEVSSPPPASVVISSLTLTPTSVNGGTSSTGKVTISLAAPAGGAVITLASNNAAASVPPNVTVPAGAKTATFPVTTSAVTANTTAGITASSGSSSKTATLTIKASVFTTLTLSPTSVPGGGTSTGTVRLSSAAPAGGTLITLTSNTPATASVPPNVMVPAGATSATFTINTTPVTANKTVTITAKNGAVTKTANLTVQAPAVRTLTLNPTSVKGGTTSTGKVTLTGAAPAGGTVVTLRSSATTVATVPASVTVAAGATEANFTVTSKVVTATKSATITATRVVSKTAVLTVTP